MFPPISFYFYAPVFSFANLVCAYGEIEILFLTSFVKNNTKSK